MKLFKGIKIEQFLSEYKEWHAAIEGFCDGFFIVLGWCRRYKPSKELNEEICGEHHYYNPAAVLGVIVFILFSVGIYKLVT